MKTATVLVLIVLIMVVFHGILVSLAPSSSVGTDSEGDVSREMRLSVTHFLNAIGGVAVTLGLVIAFLLFRVSFGRRVERLSSFKTFVVISLIPTLVFLIGFMVKPPAQILSLFGQVFGDAGMWVLVGVVGVLAFGLHGIFSLVVDGPSSVEGGG